jgi:hypothetical protein
MRFCRLLNRIYDKVMSGATKDGGAKAAIFTRALEAKKYWLKRNYGNHSVWDKIVFSKVNTHSPVQCHTAVLATTCADRVYTRICVCLCVVCARGHA